VKSAIKKHQAVDLEALMSCLPISGLEPQSLAFVGGLKEASTPGFWQNTIEFLEPPAGRRVPYIEPVKAFEKLLYRGGVALTDAQARARDAAARLRGAVADDHWVNFLDDLNPESRECLPVPDMLAWLRDQHRHADQSAGSPGPSAPGIKELLVPADIIDFLEQAADEASRTPMFRGPDNWEEPWSLETLPTLPPPRAMIEFMPGAMWGEIDDCRDWNVTDNPFLRWHEAIRPVALELERALGEPVYHFADLSCDTDDDDVHRFLVLHWCCSWKPESAYVRYLLKVSGASDVEELKAALIDPASYTQPFKMNFSFIGLEALACHFDYLPLAAHKTVAVVFMTPQAREVAQLLLAQKIGAHAFIVAPEDLANDAWVRQAAHRCRGTTVCWMLSRQLLSLMEILAVADELCVIADDKRPASGGFDLRLSDWVEELLWLALTLGVKATYFDLDGKRHLNPEYCLQQTGVPERVATREEQRAASVREMTEVRLDNDFGSSGLWDSRGRNLGYDLLNLPLPLVRRIAAWNDAYEALDPPGMGDDTWWAHQNKVARGIARDLQAILGDGPAVKLYVQNGWMTIDEIDRIEDEA